MAVLQIEIILLNQKKNFEQVLYFQFNQQLKVVWRWWKEKIFQKKDLCGRFCGTNRFLRDYPTLPCWDHQIFWYKNWKSGNCESQNLPVVSVEIQSKESVNAQRKMTEQQLKRGLSYSDLEIKNVKKEEKLVCFPVWLALRLMSCQSAFKGRYLVTAETKGAERLGNHLSPLDTVDFENVSHRLTQNS